MKLLSIATLLLSTVGLGAAAVAQQHPEPALTNDAVVKLVKAGFKEKTVIVIIRARSSRFELDPDRLIDLKRNGVSENIILAMLSQNESIASPDDDWSDDSFFKDKTQTRDNGAANNGNSADIFGSSGSTSGETRSRGMRSGNEGQRSTTGSATVRIVRPPAEAGGVVPKLEKTPTLTNESIIQLVEAGFSEGTIIKRIEDSPGDFDLSAVKLNELRKRRVTDSIIAAMTAAMDGAEPKSAPGRSGEN